MEPPQSPRDTNATDAYHARESIVSPIVEFTIPLVPTDENYLNDAWPVNKCSQIYIYICIYNNRGYYSKRGRQVERV